MPIISIQYGVEPHRYPSRSLSYQASSGRWGDFSQVLCDVLLRPGLLRSKIAWTEYRVLDGDVMGFTFDDNVRILFFFRLAVTGFRFEGGHNSNAERDGDVAKIGGISDVWWILGSGTY